MGDQTLIVKRVFNAPLEKVWDAWTDAKSLQQWHSPEGMEIPETRADARVGGELMIKMVGGPGSTLEHVKTYVMNGKFKEVVPHKKLVFTWRWDWDADGSMETLVTVEFKKIADNKTEVILTHDLFKDENMKREHNMGWESTFNQLETFLKS